MVKFFSKWIPAGTEKSKYDKNGNRVEQPSDNLALMPDKKQQQAGVKGSLEVGINEYTHPTGLPLQTMDKELFYIEISLGPA